MSPTFGGHSYIVWEPPFTKEKRAKITENIYLLSNVIIFIRTTDKNQLNFCCNRDLCPN